MRTGVIAALGVVAAGAAVTTLHPLSWSDVFWHLGQGRAVLRAGARVVPEPTAFAELATDTPVAAWLWDVAAFSAYRVAGFAGVTWLTALCTLLAGLSVIWMLRVVVPRTSSAAVLLVGTVAIALLVSRARARPEIAALVLAPLLVGALRRFAGRAVPSAPWGIACVAVALVWAQTHGSFLISPLLAAIMLLPTVARAGAGSRRVASLSVLLGILLAFTTSTAGLDVFGYGAHHGWGDGRLHVAEMHPPTWESFDPSTSLYGPSFVILVILALLGAVVTRGAPVSELGLSVLAIALAFQSVRFFALGGVLIAPLSARGAAWGLEGLGRGRPRRQLGVAAAAALIFITSFGIRAAARVGSLGTLGLSEGTLPLASAAYLRTMPEGSRALTGYDAGGILGFLLDGRVRTFVDSRTLVLFDDTEFAVARDAFRSFDNLSRAAERYRADAVVVSRRSSVCSEIAAPWFPVAIDPQWTTFVADGSRSGDALAEVSPCGEPFLRPEACQQRERLAGDLAKLRALRSAALLDLLEAAALAACDGDATHAMGRLPSRDRAEGFVFERDRLAGFIALSRGDGPALLDAVAPWAARGQHDAWSMLMTAWSRGELLTSDLLPLGRAATQTLDDGTPAVLNAMVARLYIAVGDVDGARFHGLRAAVGGAADAPRLLVWLRDHHPDADVRADAAEWLSALAVGAVARHEPLSTSGATPQPLDAGTPAVDAEARQLEPTP